MGLNATPSANRVHIGFFGRRNVGKSSLVNAVTGQETAVVSDVKGTTTDAVTKSMELLPLGPVVIIDTPGYDDEGQLGELRIARTKRVLNKTDIAVLVSEAEAGLGECEEELVDIFKKKNIPFLIVYNKSEQVKEFKKLSENEMLVSAKEKIGITELKDKLASMIPSDTDRKIVGDLIKPNDMIVLVTPIDAAAPKGRLILPQQQTIRDILDSDAMTLTVKETELQKALDSLKEPPVMVITDSQAFKVVSEIVPEEVPLTSFSILMARYKGFLTEAVKGAAAIGKLKDGDKVLICEGCTHHRQCGDIGSFKLPNWIREYSGADIKITNTSGMDFPEDLSEYALIIHCGGCMLNEREIQYRMKCAIDQGIPFTNYGTAIAHVNGILKRSLSVVPEIANMLK